jgi:hypothetical protein
MKFVVLAFVAGAWMLVASARAGQTESRTSILLLIDVSYSTRAAPLDENTQPVRNAIAQLFSHRGGDRRAAIGLVANRVLLGQFAADEGRLWNDWRRLSDKVTPAERFGPSPLWDAAAEGIDALAKEPGAKALILWTDGRPTGNRLSAVELAQRASRAGVVLYAMIQPEQPLADANGNKPLTFRPCAIFDPLVSATGGSCAGWQPGEPPAAVVRRIVEQVAR